MPAETPLFPPEIPPAPTGVYKVRVDGREFYSRWWYGKWRLLARDVTQAASETAYSFINYGADDFAGWRGLAEKPHAP